MLTKAILTGGVLSVLAGSIVYFGTEGAVASEQTHVEDVRLDETDLAGGVESTPAAEDVKNLKPTDVDTDSQKVVRYADKLAAQVDPEAKPEKSRNKFLDQYLKTKKKRVSSEKTEAAAPVQSDLEANETQDLEDFAVEVEVEEGPKTDEKPARKKATETVVIRRDGKGKKIWSSQDGDALEIRDDLDMDEIRAVIKNAGDKDVRVKIMKIDESRESKELGSKLSKKRVDYDVVLAEAKKLQVLDMRNQAMLEILDYAIDRGEFGTAADIVQELSEPELRDTARARIGEGLASWGKTEAAFAVLEELEIDELSAPIRLRIIAALMATREERAAASEMRKR